MLLINKAIYVENTFCYKDCVCQASKLQDMYVICLIPLSVLETTKQIKLNRKFLNKLTQQIESTTSLTDLCLNKKFEQEKIEYF